ncbi:MAG: RHS repeat protein [Desulfuromonadales bacterium]|nr:RHS repeat protein [Desulfuromonadales bacterium]
MRTPLFAVHVLLGLLLQSIICLPANGGNINYTYDIMGQLTRVEYPDGTVITYVYDKMGNRQSRVTSVIATAPPTVTTGSASGVSGSGATLNATVTANNLETTVTFEYGLTTAYGTTVSASQNPVTGNLATPVSRSITGLTPPFGTPYHYRAVAVNSKGTTYGGDKTLATSYPMVVVGATGSGSGAFSSSLPMIFCSGAFCSGIMMTPGVNAVITVVPSSGSYLVGWSGCDAVNANSCTLFPTADKNVTVTVDLYPVARVGASTTTYSLKVQDALTAATGGDTIKILALALTENLQFGNNVLASLKGGFTPGFAGNTGYTTLTGSLKITAGSLIVERIVLK